MSTKESTKESDEKTSGEKRTRSGCLTCKKRRVKCDEGKPRCKNCGKKGRECVYHDDSLSLKVVEYPHDVDETPLEMPATDYTFISIDPSRSRKASETKSRVKEEAQGGPSRSAVSPRSTPPSPIHPYTSLKKFGIEEVTGVLSSSNTLPPESAQTLSAIVVSPTDHEGALIHYFTEKLGRWLDCGHLVRHFTLGIPEKLESCSTLHEAVLLFAARHKGDRSINTYADEMHQLYAMERSMSEKNADTDDLLCTLLISHFVEQLNASGTQTLKFLHQASSVVDRCMGQSVDSSAPTFRDAAFWLYVRQWILSVLRYTQQPHAETPPDMHFSRQLYINPAVSNNLVKWSNEVTWHTAQIVAFCSKDHSQIAEDRTRACEWQERWDGIRKVWNERPRSMEPLFEDQQYDDTSSPRIWFKAEWHATGFGFYHLASILLLRDQQAFTNGKNKALLGGTESMILGHGRKLCGASECNPEYATLGMIFCNSVLLWFNLISGGEEQDKLVGLLRNIEGNHSWPTAWIMDGLNRSVDISMEDQI